MLQAHLVAFTMIGVFFRAEVVMMGIVLSTLCLCGAEKRGGKEQICEQVVKKLRSCQSCSSINPGMLLTSAHPAPNEIAMNRVVADTGETTLTPSHERHCQQGSGNVGVIDEDLVTKDDDSPVLHNFPEER